MIASTSGYFGGTGVVAYISSKHGIVGLARASQPKANELGVRVNVVAPFFTPTYITNGYSDKWKERGLPANTVEGVADAIVATSTDPTHKGHSVMVRHTQSHRFKPVADAVPSGRWKLCKRNRNGKDRVDQGVAG